MKKCVILKNETSEDVAKGICHNVNIDLIINSDNKPCEDDCIGVQISESFSEQDVPSNWLFQLRSWYICNIFLNGASLHNHE